MPIYLLSFDQKSHIEVKPVYAHKLLFSKALLNVISNGMTFNVDYNPKTFTGVVGKVWKRRKEGRVEKKARAVRPPGPGLEPGPFRVLGEGPQLHATGVV